MVNRKKKDYSQGKIYCVRSYKTDLIYVGSTCQPLYKRLNEHKTSYNYYLKTGISKEYSYKIYELDDKPYIELIKNYPCSCLDELRKEEGQHIRAMDCVNKNVPGRTPKEYREDNKANIKEYQKEYTKANKDKKKEKNKEYYKDNKENIKEKKNQKFICPCGGIITITNKARHELSNKHKNFIAENNIIPTVLNQSIKK